MPIVDPNEAKDLDEAIERLIRADSAADRETRLRSVFVEKLDFTQAGGLVDLRSERCPIKQAARIAEAEGVHVVWAPLSSTRILISDTRAISKALKDLLGDHVLVASNAEGAVWHFVYPTDAATKPVLRRMVVERGLPRRTVVTQLAKVYHEAQNTDVRHALESAYDVEPVTKDFFTTYRRVFDEVMGKVQGVSDEEKRRLFCQTLFNRLMFLYFLQRKGWLKFNDDSNYLPTLLRASKAAGNENFFRDRLKTLFFTGLNNPDSRDVSRGASPAIGEVPFLNGGLFEEGDIDHACAGADVPNEAFDAILGDLFERFNFTVSENTPYDIEVAVDPEMLGKVFEELVTGRHETGSYYTPRPVVAFMCREALKGYLETKVPGLSADAIRTFVDEHDVSGLDVTQADAVSDALDAVTVCDPACGSGAYLVGMLHELIDLKQALYSDRLGRDPTKLYEMKLHIIERNLYGADIDEFAINIAMLRLWLSLIIDFEGDRPPPLPNLDFKLVCDDSLTAPNPQHAPDLFRHVVHEAAGRLADLKGRYLRESGPDKPRLKTQIEDAERELQAALAEAPAPTKAVDWRVEFADIFDRQGGFDIVVANPPYVNMVQMHSLDSHYRASLRKLYESATRGFDLFVPFMERGVQLLAPSGQMAFITPNKLLSAEYATDLRTLMRGSMTLHSLTDLSHVPVFSASVYPIITIARKGRSPDVDSIGVFTADAGSQDRVAIRFSHSAPLTMADADKNRWSVFMGANTHRLIPALRSAKKFADIADVYGAATVSEAYDWKNAVIDDGKRLYESNPERYRPFVVSGNIRPFHHTWLTDAVRYIKHGYHTPVLDIQHPTVSHRRRLQIRSPKAIVSGMSKRPTCVWDSEGIAAGKSTVIVIPRKATDGPFITALINSSLMADLYRVMFGSLSLAGGYMRFGPPQIEALPVPDVSDEEKLQIATLLEKLQRGDQDTKDVNRAIDEYVRSLYFRDESANLGKNE